MKLSRKLGLLVLPVAMVLAGCETANTQSSQKTSETQNEQASIEVYQASNSAVKGFRPVELSEEQTIYVSATPVLTGSEVTDMEAVQDQEGRNYVSLSLNSTAQKALSDVPSSRGYVTVVGGQVASLTGIRQDDKFLFQTRDESVSAAVIDAVKTKNK